MTTGGARMRSTSATARCSRTWSAIRRTVGWRESHRSRTTTRTKSRNGQMPSQLWLIRHGETEWTLSGAHTGSTDIPLTDAGRRQALKLKQSLAGRRFALVLASPLSRAQETCSLAGFGRAAQIEPNLVEWRYGEYEGRTTAQIQAAAPNWLIWRSGVPGGERIAEVAARATCVIQRALQ